MILRFEMGPPFREEDLPDILAVVNVDVGVIEWDAHPMFVEVLIGGRVDPAPSHGGHPLLSGTAKSPQVFVSDMRGNVVAHETPADDRGLRSPFVLTMRVSCGQPVRSVNRQPVG